MFRIQPVPALHVARAAASSAKGSSRGRVQLDVVVIVKLLQPFRFPFPISAAGTILKRTVSGQSSFCRIAALAFAKGSSKCFLQLVQCHVFAVLVVCEVHTSNDLGFNGKARSLTCHPCRSSDTSKAHLKFRPCNQASAKGNL